MLDPPPALGLAVEVEVEVEVCQNEIGGLSVYNLDGHLLRNAHVICIVNILSPEVAAGWSFRRPARSLLLPPQPLSTQNALRGEPAWGRGAIRGGGDDTKCHCNLLWVELKLERIHFLRFG